MEVGSQISVLIVSLLSITAMLIEQGTWHCLKYVREGISFFVPFLGVFAKLRKATIGFFMHMCPSFFACNN